jgi:DNA-binding HxlR family transcriptional regulator
VRVVNGRGREKRRAGAQLLSLFATPLNGLILRALAERPLPSSELREIVGLPAPSTLRGNLEGLGALGALAMRPREGKPRQYDNSLTVLGEELLCVANAIEAWLSEAPAGPLKLGDSASKAAIGALVDGWDAAIVRALAPHPLALVELDKMISDVSYPTLSRRLGAMHLVGQVERCKLEEPKHVYRVTDWLRRAVVPLAAAARCELRHLRKTVAPVTGAEIESAFLLTLPLVNLPEAVGGTCTLAVDTGISDAGPRVAGVQVEIRDGQVTSCSTNLVESPSTWALGTVDSWLDGILDGRLGRIRIGGEEPDLAMPLVQSLHILLGTEQVLDKYI